ncbi:MAG TPA: ACT domain-containing protein [Deltaproteobacteria bacterium]|nr:ACT domain-containing protein [Deltaproteobacteria bacterium]
MTHEEYTLQQISVFLDNRPGTLSEVARYLADRGINLRALSLAETRDFGTVRLIVADTKTCSDALSNSGYHHIITDVIAVAVEDRPGGMADVLELLAEELIDVEYVYATVMTVDSHAIIILRVNDTLKAGMILASKGIRLMKEKEIASL